MKGIKNRMTWLLTAVLLCSGCQGERTVQWMREKEQIAVPSAVEKRTAAAETAPSAASLSIETEEAETASPQLLALREAWAEFSSAKEKESDPTDSFYQSSFYLGLKEYFADPKSVETPIREVAAFLGQNDLTAIDRELSFQGRDYTMRVIGYGADFYVQSLTDLAMENKNIYVQLWNEEEFYFDVLCERSHFSLLNAMTVVEGEELTLFVSGDRCSSLPRTQYMAAFRWNQGRFEAVSVFDGDAGAEAAVYGSRAQLQFQAKRWSFWQDGHTLSAVYCVDPSDEFLGRVYVSVAFDLEDDRVRFMCYDENNQPLEKTFQYKDGKLNDQEEEG